MDYIVDYYYDAGILIKIDKSNKKILVEKYSEKYNEIFNNVK